MFALAAKMMQRVHQDGEAREYPELRELLPRVDSFQLSPSTPVTVSAISSAS